MDHHTKVRLNELVRKHRENGTIKTLIAECDELCVTVELLEHDGRGVSKTEEVYDEWPEVIKLEEEGGPTITLLWL